MKDIIYQILNCYYPKWDSNVEEKDFVKHAEYNKKVAESIAANLAAYSPLKDALKN